MEFPGVVVIGPGVATAADQVMAVAQVRCLCWELPHAMVIAKRKKMCTPHVKQGFKRQNKRIKINFVVFGQTTLMSDHCISNHL